MEKCQLLRRKILSLSNISLFESETIFSRKVISDKKVIVMALCPATFRSFMVQWLAKIAGRQPQMKTLFKVILGKTMPKVPFWKDSRCCPKILALPNFSCISLLSSFLIFSSLFSPHLAEMHWKYSLISTLI